MNKNFKIVKKITIYFGNKFNNLNHNFNQNIRLKFKSKIVRNNSEQKY